jgi:hypothetical protein
VQRGRLYRNRALERLRNPRGVVLLLCLLIALPLTLFIPLQGMLGGFYGTLGPLSPTIAMIGAATLATIALFGLTVRAFITARLEVGDAGIRFHSGWPAPVAGLLDWSLGWHEVRAARADALGRTLTLLRAVELVTVDRSVRITPWWWVDPADGDDLQLTEEVRGRWGRGLQPALHAWEDTSLVRLLVARGLLSLDEDAPEADEDVQSSPAAVALASAMVVAVLYAVGEINFALTEYYVDAPWPAFVTVGAIAAAAGWGIFPARHRAHRHAIMIAAMFGLGVGIATYPLLLRANAWTDRGGLQAHEYQLTEGGRWHAVDGAAPALTFDIGTGYWKQFGPGARKTFRLRRGGLGFHQVDMSSVYAEQKAFYRKSG